MTDNRLRDFFASLQRTRPVVSGTVASVQLDETTGRPQAAWVTVAGSRVYVPLSEVSPGLAMGDAVRLEQWGTAAAAEYRVLDAIGARPASGYLEFGQDTDFGGQLYGGGDLILGGVIGEQANWWFDYSEGTWFQRIGLKIMGYIRATGEQAWGPPDGLHWRIDPSANKLSLYNGDTELRVFDGDTGYIQGWDGVGLPLGPGIRWGEIGEVDEAGDPVLDASGNQIKRYAWRVVGLHGVPVISALSGTQEDPDDVQWQIGAPDSANYLRWQDGLLDIYGGITAERGTIGGWTIDANQMYAYNLFMHRTGYVQAGYGDDIAVISAADVLWRFWAGYSDPAYAPFRVDKDGNVYATSFKLIEGSAAGDVMDLTSTGATAVQGTGELTGVYGKGYTQYGVHGEGVNGAGVYGEGPTGVLAEGTDFALSASGAPSSFGGENIENIADIEQADTGAHYFGDATTDGSWRIVRNGNNLVFERRESGSWVTKSTLTP